MRCLTGPEQEQWLSKNELLGKPYGTDKAPANYIQFRAPIRLPQIQAFTHNLVDLFWPEREALVAVEDWGLYEPYEMLIVDALRGSHGEKRPLIEASGHCFDFTEKNELIALFSLTTAFNWTAYLYFPASKVTLLNWEGALFDFWSVRPGDLESISRVVGEFDLKKK
jgi:hypothetical protein